MDDQNKSRDMLRALNEQLDMIEKQNKLLMLKSEVSQLEHEHSSMPTPHHTSTPFPPRHGPPIVPRKLMTDIPKGTSEPTNLNLPNSAQTDNRPDRFVTTRKRKSSPDSKHRGATMKPATFDGTVAWSDYKAHFEACGELNGWSDEQKGLYLSVSLRGQAQGVFGNLGTGKHDYHELVTALEERFAPPNQTELYRVQLRERHQKATESMSELGQDIRRLTNLAYPKAPADVRETLSKEQFIDALANSEMRLKIKQARPVDLNDAVRHAVELEAFYRAENKHLGQGLIQAASSAEQTPETGWKEAFSTLSKSMEEMTKAMSELTAQQQRAQTHTRGQTFNRRYGGNRPSYNANKQNRQTKTCHICKSEMHLMKDCPHRNERSQQQSDEPDKCQKGGSHQAGLFVATKLSQIDVNCLVDTGATLTLLSTKVWGMIKDSGTLEKYGREILSFSGNRLTTKGKTRVCLSIKGTSCVIDAVIAEIDVDAIIGLDFMLAHDVVVDVVNMKLSVQGIACPLVKAGRIGCNKIIVADRNSVPNRSDAISVGKVLDRDQNTEDCGTWKSSETALKATCIVLENTADGSPMSVASAMKNAESQTIETHSPKKKKRSKKRIECSTCDRAFKKRSYLSKHKFSQHKADASIERVSSSNNKVVGLGLDHSISAEEPNGELMSEKGKVDETDRRTAHVKQSCRSRESLRQVKVKCSRKDDDASSRRDVEVLESNTQVHLTTSSTRKNKGPMKVRFEDLLPDGNIETSTVELWLMSDSDVSLRFDYQPEELD